jgi:hypothetical protein
MFKVLQNKQPFTEDQYLIVKAWVKNKTTNQSYQVVLCREKCKSFWSTIHDQAILYKSDTHRITIERDVASALPETIKRWGSQPKSLTIDGVCLYSVGLSLVAYQTFTAYVDTTGKKPKDEPKDTDLTPQTASLAEPSPAGHLECVQPGGRSGNGRN